MCNATGNLVDEFNEALPTMRALGFTIKDLRVGAGLLPEIGAKLVSSTDCVRDQGTVQLKGLAGVLVNVA